MSMSAKCKCCILECVHFLQCFFEKKWSKEKKYTSSLLCTLTLRNICDVSWAESLCQWTAGMVPVCTWKKTLSIGPLPFYLYSLSFCSLCVHVCVSMCIYALANPVGTAAARCTWGQWSISRSLPLWWGLQLLGEWRYNNGKQKLKLKGLGIKSPFNLPPTFGTRTPTLLPPLPCSVFQRKRVIFSIP